MVRAALLVLSVTALWVGQTPAQQPPPPPVPVPVIPPAATTPPIPVPPPPPPPSWMPPDPVVPLPGVPAVRVAPPPPTPDVPGFFAGLELDVLVPTVHRNLNSPVSIAGVTDTVSLPNAGLEWTGSPRVEVGYRLADNAGIFSATYRSVVSRGSENVPVFDLFGTANLRSRLNVNVVDLDYTSPRLGVAFRWELNWRAGLRIAAVYFDDRLDGLMVEKRTSSNFIGAGPHLGAELAHSLEIPGVAVFGNLDGGVLIGGSDQNYEEVITFLDGTSTGGANRNSGTTTAPVLTLRLGLSYTPPVDRFRWTRFSMGYQFEQWWNVGRGQGDLNMQGFFFRGEFKF